MAKTLINQNRTGVSDRMLRILVIAYEFPPSPSPQSLRWAYLANRLAARGHEVHVLAPDIAGSMEGMPYPSPGVQVHRTHPGPVRAALAKLARRRRLASRGADGESTPDPTGQESSLSASELRNSVRLPSFAEPARLNWKGRLLERLQSVVSSFMFPDLRAEWKPSARKALQELLKELGPDVVVSSHEPATSLELGLEAHRRGLRWAADLGDPVLAPYTPRRWRKRALELEAAVMRNAEHVFVTAAAARDLLCRRHGELAPFTVVTQGFDESFCGDAAWLPNDDVELELLYSGRFYAFRDPAPLIRAILATPGVRLSIAAGSVPKWIASIARKSPCKIRLLGRIPHMQLLAVQRSSHVLVNLANEDSSQVPGKFYEYLGAGRPILQLEGSSGPDAASHLVEELRRGWVCPNETGSIGQLLASLTRAQQEGVLVKGLDLDAAPVLPWSWGMAAAVMEASLQDLVSRDEKRR